MKHLFLAIATLALAACGSGEAPKVDVKLLRTGGATLMLYDRACKLQELSSMPGMRDALEVADNNNRYYGCYQVESGEARVALEDGRFATYPMAKFIAAKE